MVDSNSTGPSEVFHYFPRLPPEVRCMIWEWAARFLRTKRGAYFFSFQFLSFTEREKGKKVDWQSIYRSRMTKEWHRGYRSITMMPPHDFTFSPEIEMWHLMAAHWVDNTEDSPKKNPSTYMINGGIWAACWDSHQALRRRMKKVRRSVRRQLRAIPDEFWVDGDDEQTELNGTFIQNSKEQMSFTLYPQRDLVCLQIPLAQAHDYDRYDGERSLDTTISFCHPRFQHLAFEFDPFWELDLKSEWNLSSPDTGLPGIIGDLAKAREPDSRLWFIDYGLRRNGWKPEVKKPWTLAPDCHVFRGNGCKFVDVSSSVEYWDTRPRQHPQPAGTYQNAHALVRDLSARVEELDMSLFAWDNDGFADEDVSSWDRELGVLACVWD
ncbi:hypothetical protein PG993_010247 [Apiospora rasikravindrae]|uniref:2EXR domain-containing protein n=1 Tax=Apiospora rasikravindrae TaxID=990691 RepID=A0ABR1SLQ4_9PEZI